MVNFENLSPLCRKKHKKKCNLQFFANIPNFPKPVYFFKYNASTDIHFHLLWETVDEKIQSGTKSALEDKVVNAINGTNDSLQFKAGRKPQVK